MTNLYLIAHLCRGEPTFDVAERQRCVVCQGVGGHMVPDFETGAVIDYEGSPCVECSGLGYWWILSTPGYRAYPWWWVALTDIDDIYELTFGDHIFIMDARNGRTGTMNGPTMPPPDAIDVFACNDRPSTTIAPTGARALLAKLGLTRPSAPIKRRL